MRLYSFLFYLLIIIQVLYSVGALVYAHFGLLAGQFADEGLADKRPKYAYIILLFASEIFFK